MATVLRGGLTGRWERIKMKHFSIFPVVENLLKGEVALYGFVPPEVHPPYVIYEDIGQTWSFPENTRGTITFILKAVSTYKGAQEINRMIALLKQKLEGVEVILKPRGKGLFRFIEQAGELKKDMLMREALLKFQVRVNNI